MTLQDLIQIAEDEGLDPSDIHLVFDFGRTRDFDAVVELSVEDGSESIARGFDPLTFVLREEQS